MSSHREDLTLVNYNQLAELTGHTYRTIKKKLGGVLDPVDQDGKTLFFNSREALEVIFLGTPEERSSGDEPARRIDIRHESARLVKLKADHLSFDLDIKKGKHVLVEEVIHKWTNQIVAFKARLRQLAAQLGEDLEGVDDTQKRIDLIEKAHDEALNEMAVDGNEERPGSDIDGSEEEASAAAETDDLTVG